MSWNAVFFSFARRRGVGTFPGGRAHIHVHVRVRVTVRRARVTVRRARGNAAVGKRRRCGSWKKAANKVAKKAAKTAANKAASKAANFFTMG